MKKTVLALAAVFALTGAAFAGAADKSAEAPKPQTKIVKIIKSDAKSAQDVHKPRVGVDIDPWFITNF